MVYILQKGASKKEIDALNKKISKKQSGKKLDAYKYCGTIQLKDDPLSIQKKIRNEWE